MYVTVLYVSFSCFSHKNAAPRLTASVSHILVQYEGLCFICMILPDAPVVLACGVVLDLFLNLHLVKCSWEHFKSHASCKKKKIPYMYLTMLSFLSPATKDTLIIPLKESLSHRGPVSDVFFLAGSS